MDKIICKICGYTCESRQSFNSHITHGHHIKSKEYYDTYLKKENDGICPTCGNQTKFRDMWYGYNKHCCTRCIPLDKEVQDKTKQTNREKYGTDYTFQSEGVKEKIRETTMKNYGVDCYLQTAECRKIVANNSRSDKVKKKIKETTMKHYGVPYSFQAESVKEKCKNTKRERYGNENYNNSEKAKQTNMDKYGVDNPAKSEVVQHKMKQTCIDRYGVDNIWKSKEYRKKLKLSAQKSLYKNGNHSSLEDYLEQFFIENQIPHETEYKKDIRYPYFCDFYLPDTDTFIEINGYWTHNTHFFDKNNPEDIKILNEWKQKAKEHSMYKRAIEIWTKTDIEKKNCAIQNKLNYIVLWNKKDIENWIKDYKL